MKKTVFLKKGLSLNLPKIKYVISEPHGDLLQWNLSLALFFDFLIHQEGSDLLRWNIKGDSPHINLAITVDTW